MNARTKLKRAEQARKRRAKITDAKRKQAEYEQWQRNLVSSNLEWEKKIREMRARREAETTPVSNILDKLFGHARY